MILKLSILLFLVVHTLIFGKVVIIEQNVEKFDSNQTLTTENSLERPIFRILSTTDTKKRLRDFLTFSQKEYWVLDTLDYDGIGILLDSKKGNLWKKLTREILTNLFTRNIQIIRPYYKAEEKKSSNETIVHELPVHMVFCGGKYSVSGYCPAYYIEDLFISENYGTPISLVDFIKGKPIPLGVRDSLISSKELVKFDCKYIFDK